MKKAKRSQKASRKGKDRAGKGQKQSKALIVTKRTQGVIKRQPKDEIIAQVLDSKEEALIASELAGQMALSMLSTEHTPPMQATGIFTASLIRLAWSNRKSS